MPYCDFCDMDTVISVNELDKKVDAISLKIDQVLFENKCKLDCEKDKSDNG